MLLSDFIIGVEGYKPLPHPLLTPCSAVFDNSHSRWKWSDAL